MIEDPIGTLAFAVALGFAAQWVSDRLGVPGIVAMLGAGLLVGPGLGVIDPDAAFGEILQPAIALGVGLLLFEGGLGLRWSEIGSTTRRVVVRMLSIGVVVTLVLASAAAALVTDLPTGVVVLFGSIMVVTGPTVVIPLLRHARLRPRLGSILRWEGIIVDPIGAVLGVCVLEVLLVEGDSVPAMALAVARTTAAGCLVGLATGAALVVALDRNWVPDHLRGPASLVAVVAAFAGANALSPEAGLYAATVLGVALANQRRVAVAPIVDLHEHLAPVVLAGIFVVLAARVDAAALSDGLLPATALLVLLVVVVRPASVAASTLGTSLTHRERAYLACLAPRGIVAASVSAVFGAELAHAGLDGGEELAATTFLVVAGTTLVYGPIAAPLARRLHVDVPPPRGVVLVGARRWGRAVGRTLADLHVPVLLVAESPAAAELGREDGLLVYAGDLEGGELETAIDGVGAGLAVVGSGAQALEAYAIDRIVRRLGRANVWRIARDDPHHDALVAGEAFEGGHAFGGVTQEHLDEALVGGATVTALDAGVDHGDLDLPLLVVPDEGTPRIADPGVRVRPSERLVVLTLTPASDAADV